MISIEAFTGILPANDSPSPLHSSEESSYHGAEAYDDHDLDASLLDGDGDGEGDDTPRRKNRARGNTTAERRATHNAVERARRETLNSRFMDLAAALPNMSSIKRPSKSAIVNKSIEFVATSQAREATLTAQNDALRIEVNELRARLGLGPLTTTPASIAMRLPAARKREPSIGSSSVQTDGTSPLLSGGASPSTTHDFTGSPLTATTQLNTFPFAANTNTVNLMRSFGNSSINDDRRLSFASSDGVAPQATTGAAAKPAAPVPASSSFNAGPFNAIDLGYLMGLQHQAAQAQSSLNPALSVLNMQTGHNLVNSFGGWQNFQPAPVSAGGSDAMNWLFA